MALVSKWLVLDGIIDFSEMTARLRSRRRLYDLFWRRAACKEKRRGRKPSRAGRKRTDGGEEGRTGKREEERTRERGRVRRKWLVVTHARFFRRTAFLKIFPPVAACRFKSPGRSRRFSNAPNRLPACCLHFVTTGATHCNQREFFSFPSLILLSKFASSIQAPREGYILYMPNILKAFSINNSILKI